MSQKEDRVNQSMVEYKGDPTITAANDVLEEGVSARNFAFRGQNIPPTRTRTRDFNENELLKQVDSSNGLLFRGIRKLNSFFTNQQAS